MSSLLKVMAEEAQRATPVYNRPTTGRSDGIGYNGLAPPMLALPSPKPRGRQAKRYACVVLTIPHHHDGHSVRLFDEREPDCLRVLPGVTIALFSEGDRDGDCRSFPRPLQTRG